MQKNSNFFMLRLLPFIAIGIFLVLLVVGFIVFSYLMIIGAIVGLVLFAVTWVYNKLFFRKRRKMAKRSGQVIDAEKDSK